MSIRDAFSGRLRALRKEIGISQEAFAEALGVARATLGYYEKGDRLPDIEFLELVHLKTGCSIEYLMGYSENMRLSNDAIGSETGLSDKAIEVLMDLNMSLGSDILNYLIEHPRFKELMRSMKILSYHSTGKYANLIDEDYREYKYYQAVGIIREICQAAYNDPDLDKEPAQDYTIIAGDGERGKRTYEFDKCEIRPERSKIDFLDRQLNEKLADLSERIRAMRSEAHAQGEESLARFRAQDAKEAERAKHDPLLRFYRRMTRTFPDGDGQKED